MNDLSDASHTNIQALWRNQQPHSQNGKPFFSRQELNGKGEWRYGELRLAHYKFLANVLQLLWIRC